MNEFGIGAGLKGFIRPLDFAGRSTRTEVLALALAYVAIVVLLQSSGILLRGWWRGNFGLFWVLIVFALYPWPAMVVRRAHDAGQGAWIALVAVLFSSLPLLIVWPGEEDANEFGPNPRLGQPLAEPGYDGAR